jgi:hypothetical protein
MKHPGRHIVWLVLLLWPGAAAAEEPAADPARKLLDELVAKMKAAKGLDLVCKVVQKLESGDDTQEQRIESEVHVAKPLRGSIRIRGEAFDMEVVGTGTGLTMLDHTRKSIVDTGDGEAWEAQFPDIFLFHAWCGETPEIKSLALSGEAAGRKLTIKWGEYTETVVVDAGGKVVSCTVVSESDEGTTTFSYAFSRFDTPADADPAKYDKKLPEGYDAAADPFEEMNASLLAVGAAVPDVTVTGMDGTEIKLADLEGKTVLLNFWFFH